MAAQSTIRDSGWCHKAQDDEQDGRGGGGGAALPAKQQAAQQKLAQFQQQQALVQQQLQRIVGGDPQAAQQLTLDGSADRMNDMLTNHFTRHSPDNKVQSRLPADVSIDRSSATTVREGRPLHDSNPKP